MNEAQKIISSGKPITMNNINKVVSSMEKKKPNRSPSPSPTKKTPASVQKTRVRRILNYAKSWIYKTKPKPKFGIKNVVSARKVLKSALTKRAARRYTHVWNKVIKEAEGLAPKTPYVPPGYTGKNKYTQALLYKQRIVNYARKHPKIYSGYLFRGIKGWEYDQFVKMQRPYVHKINLSSFTKVYEVARDFAAGGGAGKCAVLVLKTNKNKAIPSVNYTTGIFSSVYSEAEVLLPPGYFVKLGTARNPTDRMLLIYVDFIEKI